MTLLFCHLGRPFNLCWSMTIDYKLGLYSWITSSPHGLCCLAIVLETEITRTNRACPFQIPVGHIILPSTDTFWGWTHTSSMINAGTTLPFFSVLSFLLATIDPREWPRFLFDRKRWNMNSLAQILIYFNMFSSLASTFHPVLELKSYCWNKLSICSLDPIFLGMIFLYSSLISLTLFWFALK